MAADLERMPLERTVAIPKNFGSAGKAIAKRGVDADREDILAIGLYFVFAHPEVFS